MSSVIETYYQTWESELLQLRTDDLLVNIDRNKVLEEPQLLWDKSPKSNTILKDYLKMKREFGIDVLVQAQGVLHWQKASKTLSTPVFLAELQQISSENQQIEFSENWQLNPYLAQLLLNEFSLTLPEKYSSEWVEGLVEKGYFEAYSAETLIGNFHPQRYELRREWELLKAETSFSTPLLQVLGDFDQNNEGFSLGNTEQSISFLDKDQRAALTLANAGSCVVYGPPGTGKSSLISNLLAQVLKSQKTALVVSEKRSALEVVKEKLNEAQLGNFCLIAPSKNDLKTFYRQLQDDFRFLQDVQPVQIQEPHSENKAAAYWQQRQQLETETQLSFSALQAHFGQKINAATLTRGHWKNWLKTRALQQQIPNEVRPVISFLSPTWAKSNFQELEQKKIQWEVLFDALQQNFSFKTSAELDDLVKKSLICYQFQSAVFQKYEVLIDKNGPKLARSLSQYIQRKEALSLQLVQLSAWKQIPSKEEWPLLKKQAEKTGIFGQIKWKKEAKKWLRIPTSDLSPLEKTLSKYWALQEQFFTAQQKLNALGLNDPEQDCVILLQLLKTINWENYNWERALTAQDRQMYIEAHINLYRFQTLHKQLFLVEELELNAFYKQLNECWEPLRLSITPLQKIPHEIWSSIVSNEKVPDAIRADFWADLRYNFPLLYQWEEQDWKASLKNASASKQEAFLNFQQAVKQNQISKFKKLENLLTLPLSKLTENQKELRKELRKGKALLVKEMAKTRQFIPLKNLLEGPAAPWLYAIYPIWLMNPTGVANLLPLQRNLFQVGLFDEASQLPLSHSIGALQRVETAVIAGDPQQMRPSSYFNRQADGVIDLLHQAAFHLPRQLLRFHYRSENPSLIEFSNQHFYESQLKTWPSTYADKQALHLHYIENAIYQNRENKQEAKALAQDLKKWLQTNDKIGVVAFSEQQLQCIWNQLDSNTQALLEEKINLRQVFFSALEQVQGEECDHLLISFGFGKNETGEFHMRFGPMNQAQGDKRLNVLLTRAKKSLHFYCSVKASDFPAKKSPSVELIWKWFVFIENPAIHSTAHDAAEKLASADDFDSFLHAYQMLSQRAALPAFF